MRTAPERTKLRQKRMMTYFIEAADNIIKQEGLEAVTIRRVADTAGFASATLYNYFDNLDHLIFLATMNHLDAYHKEVSRRLKKYNNPVDIYLVVCDCFCEFSFRDPEIFNLLFFSNQEKLETYTHQYYELFVSKLRQDSGTLNKIMDVNNIYRRSYLMLEECVKQGYFTQENAEDFNEVAMLVFRGILKDVRENRLDAHTACEKTMRYYRQLMAFYIKPEFKDRPWQTG